MKVRTLSLALLTIIANAVAGCAVAADPRGDDLTEGGTASTAPSGQGGNAPEGGAPSAGGTGGQGGNASGGASPCEGEDCAGVVQWVRHGGGSGRDYAYGVDVADDGSVYVLGSFADEATWNAGAPDAVTLSTGGNEDTFVARYDAAGALLWATDTSGTGEDNGARLGVVASGGVVTTGWVTEGGSVTFGAGLPTETTVTSAGLEDVYVARYDALGALLWVRAAEGGDTDRPTDIAVMPDGRSIIVGRHYDDITFGGGESGEVTLVGDGITPRLFVASFQSDGTLAWAKTAGGTSAVYGQGISVDTDGSVVVTGSLQPGTATFGAGESTETSLIMTGGSMFLARYDSDGTLSWARVAAASSASQGAEGRSVAITPGGDTLVVTSQYGDAVYGLGEDHETTVTSNVSTGLVISRHDRDGALLWTRAVTDTYCWSYDVVPTQDGGAVLSGIFKGSASFGSGEPNATTVVASSGQNDAFVARYEADGNLRWVRQAGGPSASRGDYGYGVAMSPDDGIVVIGQFAESATFGAGDPSQTSVTATGKHDMFVAKMAP